MMNTTPPYNISAEEMGRYHRGELSEIEMNRLERAALDDPFLADALDGFAHNTEPEMDIEQLRGRLTTGIMLVAAQKQRTSYRLPFLRAAAAILFIASGVYLGLLISRKNQTPPLALEQKKRAPVDAIITSTDPGAAKMPGLKSSESPVINQEKVPARSENVSQSTPIFSANNAVSAEENRVALHTVTDKEKHMNVLTSESETRKWLRDQIITSDQSKDGVATTKEKPTADLGQPVGIEADESLAAAEDRFAMVKTDSPSPVSLSPIYDQSESSVSKESAGKQINSIASSVGNDASKKASKSESKTGLSDIHHSAAKVMFQFAAPVNGLNQYVKYVDEAIEARRFTSKLPLRDTVTLSFFINSGHHPVDIKIENSTAEALAEYAVKLLQEGPGLRADRDVRCKVTFTFRIEKSSR